MDLLFAEKGMEINSIEKNLGSANEDERWQAAITLGEYCETDPASIWPAVVKWGSSEDEDIRTSISTCVLEHILEYHLDVYFPKVQEIISSGNRNFADTFCRCWKFGQSESSENSNRFDLLQHKAYSLFK